MLPPLNALRAFECAARHLSFAAAAEELHVTPAAISHQIKLLEETLGVTLFQRLTRAIQLTEEGACLVPHIREGFEHFHLGLRDLKRLRNDNVLTVSAGPAFTSLILVPRLTRFMEANPDIDVRVSANMKFSEFGVDGIDVSIRFSVWDFAGLYAARLTEDWVVPLCSPAYYAEHKAAFLQPALPGLTLIHDDGLLGHEDVPDWRALFAAAGLDEGLADRGLRFNQADHALGAARDGNGVLFGRRALAGPDLQAGRLVIPFDAAMKMTRAFYLVCPKGHEKRRAILAFQQWLETEISMLGLHEAPCVLRNQA